MQEIMEIGNVSWAHQEIIECIPEFLDLYRHRPIKDNHGGMKSPHMFATWFMLKKINPLNVIESGVLKGQGTWLIQKALPNANVFSIDIDLSNRAYISDRAKYFDKDFFEVDWSFIPEKEKTVLFFDDHQDSLQRIKEGKKIGFKKYIFEDNYPIKQGDFYTLKRVFQINTDDAMYLKKELNTYYEFPPVFVREKTRWGDKWEEPEYPTSVPLFKTIEDESLRLFYEEAQSYTWICYADIK